MNIKKYYVFYNLVKNGQFETLEEAQEFIFNHKEFKKSKYTKKGNTKSKYYDLKPFHICDNDGNLYYIYK